MTTAASTEARLRPGMIIRLSDRKRPYCLQVQYVDVASKVTGAVQVTGKVLAMDGTTTRKKALLRTTVVLPGKYHVVRPVEKPEFRAVIRNVRERGGLGKVISTRWALYDEGAETLLRTPQGGVWMAREYSEMTEEEQRLRRDPVDQMMDRVRQERGVLHLERQVYDLSVWHHSSAQELRPAEDGKMARYDTYVCKRCGKKLTWLGRSPWLVALEDGDEECHGEVWVP